MSDLDVRVAELAARYRPLAASILKEAIRIPADYVDRSPEDGGDSRCGLSNHEKPRLEYFKRMLVEIGAVRRPEDAAYDGYGNLVWTVEDPSDGVAAGDKRVIYFDGHTDTVNALRPAWREKTGGIDAYHGVFDRGRLNRNFLKRELGYLPPEAEWDSLVFGRGAADQLSGVVSQVVASKILLELAPAGSLRGAVVRSYATVAEEDNDGGGPQFVLKKVLPGSPELVPDAVILTEGTGDSAKGALGLYRGQRGRMQIEVTVTGKSCHGSMPWEGRNPLEFGAPILVEAAKRYDAREGFLDHAFLGHGTRTASWARLETPSDCAVPERFVFRFDRRLTIGETPEKAVADIVSLPAVAAARAAGLTVDVTIPIYREPTWTGFVLGNPQVYMGWLTPEDHPAVHAAVAAYRGVVTPHVANGGERGALRKEPRVDRWVFSTDGVGFPITARDTSIQIAPRKRWVVSGAVKHPPMIGIGPGIEQNTHKIGECVDLREVVHAVALLARFPSAFVAAAG